MKDGKARGDSMYVDLYFLFNGLLDFLLLYWMNRVLEKKASLRRIAGVSAAAALASTLWWWARRGLTGGLAGWLFMMGLACAMVLGVWGRGTAKSFLVRLGWLFGLSILLEGLVNLCARWLGPYPWLLWAGAVLLFILGGWGLRGYYQFSGRGGRVGEVTCTVGGKSVRFYGWMDSGNLLRDPIGRRPVVIVEESVLAGLEPSEKIPIPYRSIGSEGKVMWGFCPDRLALRLRDQEKLMTAVVAGTGQSIRVHGCRAILPAQWCEAERKGQT